MKPFQPQGHLLALILYTRKFSALIDAGVSLMRCFEMLQQTTDDPALSAANARLSEKVGAGATLSAAMKDLPEVFPPFYAAFVRAGEVGGVLDVMMADLADWLEQELAASDRLGTRIFLLDLAARLTRSAAWRVGQREAENAFEGSRRLARVASFCRLFENCLTAGVPMKMALATAADVLGEPVASQVAQAAEGLAGDDRIAPALARIEGLTPVVAQMVTIGEETGSLEVMLRKAADFIDAEAAHILYAVGRLPP
jgi:type II secretory pathway component PulF